MPWQFLSLSESFWAFVFTIIIIKLQVLAKRSTGWELHFVKCLEVPQWGGGQCAGIQTPAVQRLRWNFSKPAIDAGSNG